MALTFGAEVAYARTPDAIGLGGVSRVYGEDDLGGLSLVAILSLSLCIGANTAIFSLVNAVLLRPLPYRQPEQLVWVWATRTDRDKAYYSIPNFIDTRDRQRSFAQLAGFAIWAGNLTGTGEPWALPARLVAAAGLAGFALRARIPPAMPAKDTVNIPADKLTEAQAKERGYNIKVGRFPFQPNGKALGLGDYAGFVKIVVDEKYGEILGAHMIGPEVTELLPELTLAHMMELTPHEIARNVHAHPTLSEVLMEAAHGAEGTPIHI